VVHSRDEGGHGANYVVNLPKISHNFLTAMGQHWLGKTKPKKAFRSTQNGFKKLLWNLKKKLFNGIFY